MKYLWDFKLFIVIVLVSKHDTAAIILYLYWFIRARSVSVMSVSTFQNYKYSNALTVTYESKQVFYCYIMFPLFYLNNSTAQRNHNAYGKT